MLDAHPIDFLQQQLAVLRDDYACQLPRKVAQIEDLWRRLLDGHVPVAQLEDVLRMVHGIAGSGGTFGLAVASDAARRLQRCLEPIHAAGRLPDTVELACATALIASLRQAANPPPLLP